MLEIAGCGLAVGIFGQVRSLGSSITTRITNFRRGPETYRKQKDQLNELKKEIAAVQHSAPPPAPKSGRDDLVTPSAPESIRDDFVTPAVLESSRDDLVTPSGPGSICDDSVTPSASESIPSNYKEVHAILNDCDSIMENCAGAFTEGASSSSGWAGAKALVWRVTRATALKAALDDVGEKLKSASSMLALFKKLNFVEGKVDDVGSVVGGKVDAVGDNVDAVGRKVDNVEATVQNTHEVVEKVLGNMPKEEYREGINNAEALPLETALDFNDPCAPEGILKKSILVSDSSSAVTVAAGVMTPSHGVVGMAGVGKTIALQGIAHDRDIQERFPDGIQYMTLGREATNDTARSEIVKIMRLKGASAQASAAQESASLREAVEYAVAWFHGKTCLFLVDDVWPTDENKIGFLRDIKQLLRSHRESRMAITTRSGPIAHSCGKRVDFSPRYALGDVSFSMFMTHVNQKPANHRLSSLTGDLRDSVVSILNSCAGLPIALAVAGSAVCYIAHERDDFERACSEYALKLENLRFELGEEQGPDGVSLFARISLTLDILKAKFVELKERNSVRTDYTIADLYTSLCVLQNQGRLPISALSGMWEVENDFALVVVRLLRDLSLCNINYQDAREGQGKERAVMLHDLQLEYCRRKAETKNPNSSSAWHNCLLNGYLKPELNTYEASFEQKLLAWKPRAWWSARQDGYILVELARHLVCAGLSLELAALLLDARWTHKWFEIGGLLSLKGDIGCLLALEDKVIPESVRKSFDLVFKSIQVAWGRKSESERSFLFSVCGWLCKHRAQNQIADAFLNSVESNTEKPYLRPVNAFFPDLLRSLIMEISLGERCLAVDSSPCGRFVAAGADADVVVVDVSKGEILKRLEGHTDTVTCVSFAGGSERIVSGSEDNSIAVWDWKTSECPVRVLTGRSYAVKDVVVSSDGEKIFSCCGDRTLRIWNANTGIHIEVYLQQSYVECLSVSNDDRLVAMGLGSGNLTVLNIGAERTIFEDSKEHRSSIDSVGFCRTGYRLLTVSRDACRVWDIVTWTSVRIPILPYGGLIRCVKVSPDGLNIASGHIDGTLRLWDVKSRNYTWHRKEIREPATSLSFTADGETMISGHLDGMIRFWDTSVGANATESKYWRSRRVTAVASSDDGLRIVSVNDDGSVFLSDSRTGNLIGSMKGHTSAVSCVSFSHDGRKVVFGSSNGTIQLWGTETFNQIGNVFKGHKAKVTCLSFSSDDKRIISASIDFTVRTWDVKSGTESEDVLRFKIGIRAVYESSDRSCVVLRVVSCGHTICIWNRSKQNFVWASRKLQFYSEDESTSRNSWYGKNELTDREAQEIIRNCAQTSSRLWPDSFFESNAELYFREMSVYSNVPKENALLGTMPFHPTEWRYNETTKTLVVMALRYGYDPRIAICRLIL